MASGIVESSQSGGSQEQGQQQQSRSPMQQHKFLQRLYAAGSNLPAFMAELITTQAVVVAGTEAAAFPIEAGAEGHGRPQANLVNPQGLPHNPPDNSTAEVRQQAIAAF